MPATVENEVAPRSLNELLSLPIEELDQVDIGRANLLCTEGLPGAEGLDVEEHVGRLDAWAERCRRMTQHHLPGFSSIAHHFQHSEPKWRLCAMAKLLRDECGVGYHEQRINGEPDWSDSQDLLIHGLTGPRRRGTCASLPVFFVAIARRLGYPVHLAKAPAHCFSRWDGADSDNAEWREQTNVEFHGDIGFNPDEHYYEFPLRWPESMRRRHRTGDPSLVYLEALPPAEEFANSLCQRAVCLEAVGRHREAVNAYYECERYDARWGGYRGFARRALRSRAAMAMKESGYEPDVIRSWYISRKLRESGRPLPVPVPVPMPIGVGTIVVDARLQPAPINAALTAEPETPTARHEREILRLATQPFGPPPKGTRALFRKIVNLACGGTPAEPSLDLLLPHPPEPEVKPYGCHRQ
jgi:hypothetical protein